MIDPVATAPGTDTPVAIPTRRDTDTSALACDGRATAPIQGYERGVEIDCGGRAGDSFVALRSHLCTFGRGIGRGLQLREIDRFKQVLFAVEDADVRTIELVRRTCKEVAVHFLNVAEKVRRVMDGINQCERAD